MSQAIGILELTSIAKDGSWRCHVKKRECEFTGQQDHLPGNFYSCSVVT
jgi:hypothetical protein